MCGSLGSFDPLISARILDWTYRVILPMVRADEPKVDPISSKQIGKGVSYPHGDDLGRVGHSLFDILAAFLGGLLGRLAYRRYRSPSAQ